MNWLKKLIIKQKTIKTQKFFELYTQLGKKRIYINQKDIKKISKSYRRVYKFYNSSFYSRISDLPEYKLDSEIKDDFITKYNRVNNYCLNINSLIKEHQISTNSFLNELNKLKINPNDGDLINQMFNYYSSTYDFIKLGSVDRLTEFNKLTKYYDYKSKYINIWCNLKEEYQEMVSFINIVKEYKLGYINDLKLITLKGYKDAFRNLTSDEFKEEIVWNKDVISKTDEFLRNIDSNIRGHNYKYLDKVIINDFLIKYSSNKSSLFNDGKFYLINKINTLVKEEDISLDSVNNYFKTKHSEIDDYFEKDVYCTLANIYKNNIKLLANIYIDTNNKEIPYCQIDLMIFYKGDIYVLELKDYSGKIYGSYKSESWKQIFVQNYSYKNSKKIYTKVNKQIIYNPIKQNDWHIHNLMKVYNFNYKNVVLFSDNSELFVSANNVFTLNSFIDYLNGQPARDNSLVEELYYRLCLLNKGKEPLIKKQHVKSIQNHIYKNQ